MSRKPRGIFHKGFQPFPGAIFEHFGSYWQYESSLMKRARYVHEGSVRRFLSDAVRYAESKTEEFDPGAVFYRAVRIDFDDLERRTKLPSSGLLGEKEIAPLGEERMHPSAEYARQGRANVEGIPVLYLSSDPETAASEVRAYKGSGVSIAEYHLERRVKTIRLEADWDAITRAKSTPEGADAAVWFSICQAFAKPAQIRPNKNGYAPTQVLSEVFKAAGFDGFIFQSSVAGGRNWTLFDLNAAKIQKRYVRVVNSVSVELSPPSPQPDS